MKTEELSYLTDAGAVLELAGTRREIHSKTKTHASGTSSGRREHETNRQTTGWVGTGRFVGGRAPRAGSRRKTRSLGTPARPMS